MRRMTSVCRPCNRTWVCSLSPKMADAYASTAPKPMSHDVEPVADSRQAAAATLQADHWRFTAPSTCVLLCITVTLVIAWQLRVMSGKAPPEQISRASLNSGDRNEELARPLRARSGHRDARTFNVQALAFCLRFVAEALLGTGIAQLRFCLAPALEPSPNPLGAWSFKRQRLDVAFVPPNSMAAFRWDLGLITTGKRSPDNPGNRLFRHDAPAAEQLSAITMVNELR